MKRILFNIGAIATLLAAATGCRKYVEIQQPGVSSLYKTSDYQGLLYNSTDIEQTIYYPEWASDDIDATDSSFAKSMFTYVANTYTWAPSIFVDAQDDQWNKLYHQVYLCNLITTGINDSKGGSDADKKYINAQALVHRAYAFLTLVNIYAKQYDATSAANDPGIPLLFAPDFNQKLNRAPVADVYTQVKKDLLAAIPYLSATGAYNIEASQAAAFGTLARASLQQGLYTEAEQYADSALARQNTLINLADYNGNLGTFPTKLQHPEIIFSKLMSTIRAVFPLSNGLQQLFDTTNDLRYRMYTSPGNVYSYNSFQGRGYYADLITNEGVYTGPSVPEMMLIKAEAEARNGHTAEALAPVNALRQHRFLPAGYTPLTAATPAAALQLVLDERRRELMCTGARWFDLKRLNKETAFAVTITHHYRSQTLTLAPNSNEYVFPIGNIYIQQNPEIVQNPR